MKLFSQFDNIKATVGMFYGANNNDKYIASEL